MGALEVPLLLSSFELITLPIQYIPLVTVCLRNGYIEVTLISLPRYRKGYLQRLFCRCPGQVGVRHHSLYMR